ncbi:MAG: 5-deoxyadenosylcobinamide phosphate nucleotidyltransferase [Crenarchaeota archaeon]|nr:MAG: 5-deoxyadenosylcobinamide phosphate nucleotidyltransferase [Thermoproteota archaeon]RDJ33482.1 MAG: 5-deoxyadenosylcobinamide phosphate nucleotidyltransferase [Thermoproteota archaeon]RDJ34894.1 MAG: 5-deoxyadenosylcobinamide phosphate nucleotidyltransferase [Thermoproteota archaeon]RDJ38403.1 MAG: 5-deoxyadenosylcobinamide phosphate nucleotidyltransferase [Thermoproteota archaeon]
MIGLVMAGGKGTRMEMPDEKLLLTYRKPVILHVIDALKNSNSLEKIFAATSSNSPKTQKLLKESGIPIIQTSGKGYANDLNAILQSLDQVVLVISGDLPFLDDSIIKQIIESYDGSKWTSFVITKGFLESLNISSAAPIVVDGVDCYYSGVSIIDASKITNFDSVEESFKILDDKRIAFNLNTKQDYDLLGTT